MKQLAKLIVQYFCIVERNLVLSFSVNLQSGSKLCITLVARSAQIFDRCVGTADSSLDHNSSETFKLLGGLGKLVIKFNRTEKLSKKTDIAPLSTDEVRSCLSFLPKLWHQHECKPSKNCPGVPPCITESRKGLKIQLQKGSTSFEEFVAVTKPQWLCNTCPSGASRPSLLYKQN